MNIIIIILAQSTRENSLWLISLIIPYCDCMRKKGEFVQRCSTFVRDQRETVNCSAAVHHIYFSCWIVWEVSQIVKYFEQVTEHSSKAPQLQRRKPGQGEQIFTS